MVITMSIANSVYKLKMAYKTIRYKVKKYPEILEIFEGDGAPFQDFIHSSGDLSSLLKLREAIIYFDIENIKPEALEALNYIDGLIVNEIAMNKLGKNGMTSLDLNSLLGSVTLHSGFQSDPKVSEAAVAKIKHGLLLAFGREAVYKTSEEFADAIVKVTGGQNPSDTKTDLVAAIDNAGGLCALQAYLYVCIKYTQGEGLDLANSIGKVFEDVLGKSYIAAEVISTDIMYSATESKATVSILSAIGPGDISNVAPTITEAIGYDKFEGHSLSYGIRKLQESLGNEVFEGDSLSHGMQIFQKLVGTEEFEGNSLSHGVKTLQKSVGDEEFEGRSLSYGIKVLQESVGKVYYEGDSLSHAVKNLQDVACCDGGGVSVAVIGNEEFEGPSLSAAVKKLQDEKSLEVDGLVFGAYKPCTGKNWHIKPKGEIKAVGTDVSSIIAAWAQCFEYAFHDVSTNGRIGEVLEGDKCTKPRYKAADGLIRCIHKVTHFDLPEDGVITGGHSWSGQGHGHDNHGD